MGEQWKFEKSKVYTNSFKTILEKIAGEAQTFYAYFVSLAFLIGISDSGVDL